MGKNNFGHLLQSNVWPPRKGITLLLFFCPHCKIRIFLNFIYGIFFHPFKNIVPKGRKSYLLTTVITIWKLEIFHKRWNLTHFQNYKILFTNLWKIIPYFRNLFHAIPKIKKLFPSDTEENSIMQESVSQVFWLLKLTQLS